MEPGQTRNELLETIRAVRRDLDQAIAETGPERIDEPGTFGPWSFKDQIAHLTLWRLATAARLEAGVEGREPVFPWPDIMDEGTLEGVDAINQWFYEANRDKPLAEVVRESNETFERVERAIAAMPEDALLMPGYFPWVHWTDLALGPAVVRGTLTHYREDHEPAIREWLARD
jgi:hypothetical protein